MTTPRNPDIQLRQALLGLAHEIAAGDPSPPASTIWLRAGRRSRQLALDRAARPLRLMYAFATAAALVAAAFILHQTGPLSTAIWTQLLHWSAPAFALIVTGGWAMIHTSRKPQLTNR